MVFSLPLLTTGPTHLSATLLNAAIRHIHPRRHALPAPPSASASPSCTATPFIRPRSRTRTRTNTPPSVRHSHVHSTRPSVRLPSPRRHDRFQSPYLTDASASASNVHQPRPSLLLPQSQRARHPPLATRRPDTRVESASRTGQRPRARPRSSRARPLPSCIPHPAFRTLQPAARSPQPTARRHAPHRRARRVASRSGAGLGLGLGLGLGRDLAWVCPLVRGLSSDECASPVLGARCSVLEVWTGSWTLHRAPERERRRWQWRRRWRL